ncbi:Peptide-N4-(N-acetyl-beta-glucosaminyl)asparagine amidase A [Apostasia shenzhenica]|uniref:Peptide-N4-(N-acetyl-beta-glucosaminyl)asparagine amidase A n=1 Tax=Apostasia shenzhenica TaxID=1088818 RepID=A0A2I0BGI8_9ASPA|nr:Peptide-N4-(N-acetyl-beta-glucosaminyl)asparagine amidase A [Apostasia shenzhenica]
MKLVDSVLLSLFFTFLSVPPPLRLSAAIPPDSPIYDYDFEVPPPSPSPPPAASPNTTLEYMDLTLPPLLPTQSPKCSVHVLQRDFAHTVGSPPVTSGYIPPPECPAPWSRVVLELAGAASDVQKDRIAAVWLAGVEVLRTSTPFSMSPGVFWYVRKDVTRYTALLRHAAAFSMMLENSNATFPGVFSVNVSLHFYRGAVSFSSSPVSDSAAATGGLTAHPIIRGFYREPADLIIPISRPTAAAAGGGHWFRVTNETDRSSRTVLIPNNTYRAVLEVYASHHSDDEYWYANPLRSSGATLASDCLESKKPNGAFRQVVATLDGRYVGSAIPFPVITPGSVNPFFWAPVAAIGAYDHPSYDFDLTPFVGKLIDGGPHEFGLTVKECQPFWLVGGNLHLWLDAWSDAVEGGLIRYKVPPLRLGRQADWKNTEGKSEMEGQVIIRFSGWVSSSAGNVTTSVRHKLKFKSHVEVEEKGEMKTVEMEMKARTNLRIERDHAVVGRVVVETESPLNLVVESSNGGGGTRIRKTKLFHEMMEARSSAEGKGGEWFSTITDRQEAEGSVLVGEDGEVVWGSGETKSTYKYRDDKKCYLRTVNMVGGKVKEDEESSSCVAAAADF